MFARFQGFFRRSREEPPAPVAPAPAPPRSPELLEAVELLKKGSRMQAKIAVRMDELEQRLLGAMAELKTARALPESRPVWPSFVPLLDAMDLLDHARQAIEEERAPGVAEGLSGILAKLELFLASTPLRRVSPLGQRPDGRLFRVVGRERTGAAAGVVTRVVRTAVIEGDRVVREGEVLVEAGSDT
jgi:molecular chaperone GrpE (heat shock protein)